MNDKPGKPGKPTGKAETEPEREKRPRRAEEATTGKGPKRKPGDAARKMREMYKG
ncbi:hypothetical protein [Actinomadura sp. WMMA1423]|uniref:hypothetical protein n=1 Tax=Actinomadura sp. WMMA1423 TaxID=2591108 RepID=UPI00143D3556|nr:hypothetical protein [Actinomadura sp. WMMA1423]